ncbi:MAG: hypothetical protein WC415_06580 [Patescibacteria group bacterium]|jgi:hypothetical protein
MSKEYGVICILEMTVEGENQRDARRIVEDAIYEAFDSKAEKDCNPLIGRTRITVGGDSIVFCGGL